MKHTLGLLLSLLLGWSVSAWAQGQMINGDRTVTGAFNAGTTTGTGAAYVLTLDPVMPAYLDRQCYQFKAHVANTSTTPTLNVNGRGAKTLQKRVEGAATALGVGEIGVGQYVQACYDGTVMQVMSLGASGIGVSATTLTGDVTGSGVGTVPTAVVSLPSGVIQAGYLFATAITAPGTPAAGKGHLYLDSTSKNVALKDDAGVVKHGVQTINCGAQFVSAINDAGLPTCNTPAGGGNVSNSGTPTVGLTAEFLTATTIQGIANTGTGLYVKQTSATLITPALGVATATSVNKVAITAPATSATLTIANGKTLTASNTLTLLGTDGSTLDMGAGGAVTFRTGTPSAGQAAEWTNSTTQQGVAVTGTGSYVKASTPTFTGSPVLSTPTATSLGLGQAAPATAGMVAALAGTNNLNLLVLKRNTDSSPTGNFALYQNAAGGTLWQVDIAGSLAAGIVPFKRVTRVTTTLTTAVALPCNADISDICVMANTEATGNLTLTAPTGSFVDGQPLRYRISCSNTQTYVWNAAFRFSTDIPQPTTCTPGGTDYFGFIFSAPATRWDLAGAVQNISG